MSESAPNTVEKTPRQKYEAFRALYGNSDPHRVDHVRFDRLIRLLLGLPETDDPPYKRGQFVRVKIIDVVFRVEHVKLVGDVDQGWMLRGQCADGANIARMATDVEPVDAWNEEIPF